MQSTGCQGRILLGSLELLGNFWSHMMTIYGALSNCYSKLHVVPNIMVIITLILFPITAHLTFIATKVAASALI